MAFIYKHGDTPLEGYVIQRGVGRGGFGEVYYALSEGGKEVALKYLRENPQIELRGVSHCMNLKSPHLVTIYDVKQNGEGEHFIVMEYVHGPSLRDLLVAEPNGLGVQKAAFFVSEIAKGLAYLHDRGIIHRDMKPGNIFYEDGYVKIGDYGLSKFISLSRHSGQTASIGTVHYMAPEVGSGNYHRGIDIYALGVMLYEMLLGKVPFEGSSMGEVLMKHLTEQPEIDALPEPFGEVIRKALAKDPAERYQSVEEMAQDILGAEHVRKSVAGFEPGSLSSIARQAMDTQVMDTPHPSPHGGLGAGAGAAKIPVPRRRDPDVLDARAFSNRLAQRMERVAARAGRPALDPLPEPGLQQTPASQTPVPATKSSRIQGFIISAVVALGLSVGIALVAAPKRYIFEFSAMTFAFILAIRVGVFLAELMIRRMTAPASSTWATRLVTLGCCTIPVLIVGAIAGDELRVTKIWNDTNALMIAVLAGCVAIDWIKRLRHGLLGRVEFADAFKAGLFGLIAGAVLGEGESEVMFLSAGIAAATSLSIQAAALFRRPAFAAPSAGGAKAASGPQPEPARKSDEPADSGMIIGAAAICGEEPGSPKDYLNDPMKGYEPPSGNYVAGGQAYHTRRPRPVFFRMFWALASAVLLCGAGVCALGAALIACGDDELMGFVIGAACSGIMAIFTLLKTTAYKRIGFWNDSLRPFLACIFYCGVVALGCVLGFMHLDDDELFGVLCGMIPCAVFALLFTFLGPRHRVSAPVSAQTRRFGKLAASAIVVALIVSVWFMIAVRNSQVIRREVTTRLPWMSAIPAAVPPGVRVVVPTRPIPNSQVTTIIEGCEEGRLAVKGTEDLFYTWSPGTDGRSAIVSLHSHSFLPEAELLYVIRNPDGTVAEENVFAEFEPGDDLTDVWHTGLHIEDGELTIQLVGSRVK